MGVILGSSDHTASHRILNAAFPALIGEQVIGNTLFFVVGLRKR